MSDDVLVTFDAGVTTLTLHRPGARNALTNSMYKALASALGEAGSDPHTHAVVLQGSDSVFSAGNDIAAFLQEPPVDDGAPVFRFLEVLAHFGKPIVAAVCGPAVGIGATMLFHADLVYAGDNTRIIMPFTSLGVSPEAASSLLGPQLMGYHRAAEALLLGEPLSAMEALTVGLVNQVLPAADVRDRAAVQARKLAALPPRAIQATKRLMKHDLMERVSTHMREEAITFVGLLQEPAAQSALAAFAHRSAQRASGRD